MRRLAVTLVVLVALTAMARAVPYLFATEYLPYHAAVAGRAWSEVDPVTPAAAGGSGPAL